MIELFAIAENDQSLYFLGRIFGVVGTVIPPTQFPTNEPPPIILSQMFEVLNSVALTVGVLIVTYTTIVGLFATAAEGEFLGKKWSGLWVPIRTVLGIAGLFPASGGYCAIQVFLMWLILQGVGAADVVWTRALDVIAKYGSPWAGVGADTITVNQQVRNIFQGLVCQETALLRDPDIPLAATGGIGKGGATQSISYFCANNPTNAFCTRQIYDLKGYQSYGSTDNYRRYNMGPSTSLADGGACGYIEYANKDKVCQAKGMNSVDCKSATQQEIMITNMISNTGSNLRAVAQLLVSLDRSFAQFYEYDPKTAKNPLKLPDMVNDYCQTPPPEGIGVSKEECCVLSPNPTPDAPWCLAFEKGFDQNSDIYDRTDSGTANTSNGALLSIYIPFGLQKIMFDPKTGQDFLTTITNQYIAQVIDGPLSEYQTTNPNDWIDDAKRMGWLMAGGYYFDITKRVKADVNASPHFIAITRTTASTPLQYNQRNNLKTANRLITNITGGTTETSSVSQLAPSQKEVTSQGIDATNSAMKDFMVRLTDKTTDPIQSIAVTGIQMMRNAQTLFVVYSATAGVMSALSNINIMTIGTGLTSRPAYAVFTALMTFFGPFLIIIISTLFTLGALLGVYVPLIPYIVYTVTAVGWFIGVIEAMVAAPFVALGIMSPGGQHEILSRAEPSLMILFNLFLRPALMVFGMISAMLLSVVIVKMVNGAFAHVMDQIFPANSLAGGRGIIEQIVFMGAYTILIVTVLSKCYTLIHMLPERTLTYIGGHAIQFGEAEAMQQVKGAVEGAAGGMAKAARGAAAYRMREGKPKEEKKEDTTGGTGQ